ncbi:MULTISPECIES: glycogen synthase [Arthrobacter]|uniref:D-inositol 3-phosphate glycosyltransferase n=1 Tax=Arthrobacter terricola TaxID=2547396 RepID=A0A4R5K9R5_9MICC|nr:MULTISPECIES: glycogen synthase [Arthrobacter]MBT8162848.1 glycogen synthase [Arthrobacter sp. GN70]TDF91921.1 glycogen synthase [Arthrobacter terricola]
MRVDIVTKEFPPEIYGGAGVHVAELSRVLAKHVDLQVRAFGAPREAGYHGATVTSYSTPEDLGSANAAVQTLGVDLRIVPDVAGADLVHSHTWYANMAGHLASLLHGIPHVLSAHSLEPLRPWKAEQLGGGYALSSWVEKTAYEAAAAIIAVSDGMRQDILRSYPNVDPAKVRVVHNGIDVDMWQRDEGEDAVRALGIDPAKPSVVFVGRNTRQKGVPYLLRAAASLPADVQLVLCLGAADTPELAAETARLIEDLQDKREGVLLIERMLPRHELIQVLSHATAFACPSIYEPLGIVNLEAMACGAAVVASATGGIPEVVQHGETGLLVELEQVTDGTGTPLNPEKFVADFAAALNEVVSDPERAKAMGAAGRIRAEQHFSWESITETTLEVYRSVLGASSAQAG